MNKKNHLMLLCALSLSAAVSCEPTQAASGSGKDDSYWQESVRRELKLTPVMELNRTPEEINSHAGECGRSHLALIYDSFRSIGTSIGLRYPVYPRITKLADGSWFLTWQQSDANGGNGRSTYWSVSDDLVTWSPAEFLFKGRYVTATNGKSENQWFTNANSLQLKDGRLMVVSSFYTLATYSKESGRADQGIKIKFTSDRGKTWTSEQTIYTGPNWEAHLMETEEGQIQVYFSESRPWTSGSHSGTSLVVSDDGGRTWTPKVGQDPYRVMRKKWHDSANLGGFDWKYTYQMPVGIRLNNSKKMAFSMECITGRTSGGGVSHAMSVVYSPDDGNWVHLQGEEIGPTGENLEDFVTGATGPYLIQCPSGETVLSYGKSNNMNYMIGDENARNFKDSGVLFPIKSGGWSGMANDTDHTIIAVDRDLTDGKEAATIMLGRFWLNHSIKATARTASIDGDSSEWTETDDALYVGSISQSCATLRCSQDGDNLYFLAEIRDNNLTDDDQFCLFLASDTPGNKLNAGSRRFRFSPSGLRSVDKYSGGWTKAPKSSVKYLIAYDGTINGTPAGTDKGYVIEFAVPKSELGITDGRIACNMLLYDSSAAKEDSIVPSASNDSSNWVYVYGL